jgi:glycosyltransferase involved in cell wall biosynthesis
MNKSPLLSIVVPTKDRYKYLKHLIELIDSFNSNEIELVLHDNTEDNTEIVEFLNLKNYSFIRYAHKGEKIPVSLNADLAILNSTGEYVSLIGDDDGVCRNIIDCVKWMQINNVEAVFSRNAYYSWGKRAKVVKNNKIFVKHSAKRELNRLLKHGLILTKADVPLLYHGIVKREKLDEIFKIGNTFFGGPTPDISSAINLSFVIDNYYEIRSPLIINGTSEMTGGGVIKQGGVVHLADISFISSKDKESWEKEIPAIWTGTYAWANSGIKSLKYMGKDDLIKEINRNYYLAGAVVTRPRNKVLIKYALKYTNNRFLLFLLILKMLLIKYLTKARNLNMKKYIFNNNVNTIVDAEKFFTNNSINPFNN